MSEAPAFDESWDPRPGTLRAVWLPIALMGVFIAVSALVRPVIAPDETRYLTVAWEMWVRDNFVLPTLNFVPYHQKPPMLFWTIDLFWAVFGVSRWAALLAIFVISSGVVLVSRAIAAELFADDSVLVDRVCWLAVGNVVFVVYCGLVMFDLMLTFFTALAILALLRHARAPSRLKIAIAGLATGLGVITKGPVILFFLVPLMAAYPLWKGSRSRLSRTAFWKSCGLAAAVALVPVVLWLAPLIVVAGGGFMEALVWKQAAGRVTGDIHTAHSRPFWFYLPLLPLFFLPWIVSPDAWRARAPALKRPAASLAALWRDWPQVRFMVFAIVPTVVLFSLVSGKAPHYIEPLLPVISAALALFLRPVRLRLIEITTVGVLAVFIVGQGVAAIWVLPRYDLSEAAGFVAGRTGPLAVVGNYHGEFGFLARLNRPFAEVEMKDASAWLKRHPDGTLIGLELRKGTAMPGRVVFEMPYRSSKKEIVAVEAATPDTSQ